MGDFPVAFATVRLPAAFPFPYGVAKLTLFPDGTANGELIATFDSQNRAKGYAADQHARRACHRCGETLGTRPLPNALPPAVWQCVDAEHCRARRPKAAVGNLGEPA